MLRLVDAIELNRSSFVLMKLVRNELCVVSHVQMRRFPYLQVCDGNQGEIFLRMVEASHDGKEYRLCSGEMEGLSAKQEREIN